MKSDFYELDHQGVRLTLPRVTSILGVLDKPALMWWAAKMERESLRAALEDALTTPGPTDAQTLWNRMSGHLAEKRAWLKHQDQALNIGWAAHHLIEWHTMKMLGAEPGPEPAVPDASLRAVLAWLDWVQMVGFTPLATEAIVYCPRCRYAGTCDTVAKVAGVLTVIDYKTSKAIYPEALLQVNFYRHAGPSIGIEAEQAMVVRLPKTAADPLPEMVVAPVVPLRCLQAILTTWRTMRWIKGEEYGATPPDGKMCPSEPKATPPEEQE